MTDPIAIDVSHWQEGTHDAWNKLRNAGIKGVFHKCTESSNYLDPEFEGRYETAIKEGFATSSYHFMRPGPTVQAQMNWYLNNLDPRDGERVVLDHEDSGVSLSYLKDCVEYLLSDSRNLQVTIYSGNVIKEQLGSKADTFLSENTSLWLAHYTTGAPSWPKQVWEQWSLWQYTDQGTVAGYSPLDLNRFNGSDDDFVRWMGPAGELPVPVPPEELEVVIRVHIDAPEGVNVRFEVD